MPYYPNYLTCQQCIIFLPFPPNSLSKTDLLFLKALSHSSSYLLLFLALRPPHLAMLSTTSVKAGCNAQSGMAKQQLSRFPYIGSWYSLFAMFTHLWWSLNAFRFWLPILHSWLHVSVMTGSASNMDHLLFWVAFQIRSPSHMDRFPI